MTDDNLEAAMRVEVLHSPFFAFGSPVVVLALNYLLDAFTHSFAGDWLALVYFAGYGIYCIQNFFRCREFHCAITGPGFLLAAALMALRVSGVFDHGYGVPYIVFFLAALAGHALESRYFRRTHTRFLNPPD